MASEPEVIDALEALVGSENIPILDPNFKTLLAQSQAQYNTAGEAASFLANAIRTRSANDPAVMQAYGGFTGNTVGSTGTTGDANGNGVVDVLEALMGDGGGRKQPSAFSKSELAGLGLGGTDLDAAFLAQFGIGQESKYAGQNAASASTNASANYMNALTNAAQQKATEAYQQGQLALQEGQLDLAERQFASSDYWTGVANDLAQRKFSLDAAATPAQIATQMFGAQTNDMSQRGALDLGAASQYGGLASLLGNLATTQANMGINLLTNPRNAVTAFLLGQGSDPSKAAQFGQFNVERLLGIDPAQIQSMIQAAAGAANNAQNRANQPNSINLQSFLDALSNAAKTAGTPSTSTPPSTKPSNSGRNKPAPSTPAQPEESFQRAPSGTVTVRPNNPVVQQARPRFEDPEPPRGPFVNRPSWVPTPEWEGATRAPFVQPPTNRDVLVNVLLGNSGADLATNVRRSLFPEDTSYL